MSWILILIAVTFLWAGSNIIDKYVVSRRDLGPMVLITISATVSLVFGLMIIFKAGLMPLSALHVILALLCGAMGAVWLYLYFKAMALGEVSRLVPIMYLVPVFIAVFAWIFLGETLAWEKYFGILLLISGAMLISLRLPFSLRLDRPFWLMLMATLLGAILQIIQKYLLGFADFWTIFAYARLGFFLAIIPLIFMYFSDFVRAYKEKRTKLIGLMIISDSISYFGGIIFIFVLASSSVTIANAVTSTQPFFVFLIVTLLGIFYPKILKEDTSRSMTILKLASIAIIFIGGILIS